MGKKRRHQIEAKSAGDSAMVLDRLPNFGGAWRETTSGESVSWQTAIAVTAVFSCMRVLAEGVAQVPINFYRVSESSPPQRFRHPLADVLSWRPNGWMTSFELRETMVSHAVLCGNAFAFINRVGGRVHELIPIEPQRVAVTRHPDMTLTYQVTFDDGTSPVLTARDIWHMRGPSWNGWMGMDVVRLAREAIGLGLATERAHARLHANGVQPSGIYSVEGTLTPKQFDDLGAWLKKWAGGDKSGAPLVLDHAAKWISQQMTGVDSQHLETRRFQVEEICRAIRVIPLMAGYSDKAATYASAEQMFIAHVVHGVAPWATRWEQSAEISLLDVGEKVDIRLNLKGLMRGAIKDRAEYNAKALGSGGSQGWMTPNEVREDEGLDWIEGGDKLPAPTNVPAPTSTPNA